MSYRVSAKQLYQRQNQTLHRAFSLLGMPYQEEKGGWLSLFRSLLKRENINGLTDLTLGERRTVIAYLGRQGIKIKNPFLPGDLADWSSGDPERTALIRSKQNAYPGRPNNMDDVDKGRLLKKIEALLAEAGRPWKYAHSMAKRISKDHTDRVQWCDAHDLHKIVAALMYDAKRHGRYTGG
jgi:phage gp16-like protein